MTERRMSQRRACGLFGLDRKSFCYRSRRPDDEAVREKLRAVASERRRFGYRRLGWVLERQGIRMNHKKL
jgi:putative transposase